MPAGGVKIRGEQQPVGVFWMVILPIFRLFRHYQQDSLLHLWWLHIQDDVARITKAISLRFINPLLTG